MPVLMWFLRYWHFSASNFSSFLTLSIRLCYALHRPKIVLILSPRVSSDINKREFCISSSESVLKFHKLLNKTLHKIKVLHLHVSSIIFTCFVSYLHGLSLIYMFVLDTHESPHFTWFFFHV